MMKLVKWLFGGSRADRLLLAATVVAGVRMMIISAVFIGFNLDAWAWFKAAEVWSGLAYAILEGVALAYVSSLWVKLRPVHYVEWGYWAILALGQLVLFGSIIGVTGFAATAVRRDVGVDALLGDGGAVAWSMFVTALNPLMVILIGISRAIDPQEQGQGNAQSITIRKGITGPVGVEDLARVYAGAITKGNEHATPDVLIAEFEAAQGVTLGVAEAEAALAAAGRRNGRGKPNP